MKKLLPIACAVAAVGCQDPDASFTEVTHDLPKVAMTSELATSCIVEGLEIMSHPGLICDEFAPIDAACEGRVLGIREDIITTIGSLFDGYLDVSADAPPEMILDSFERYRGPTTVAANVQDVEESPMVFHDLYLAAGWYDDYFETGNDSYARIDFLHQEPDVKGHTRCRESVSQSLEEDGVFIDKSWTLGVLNMREGTGTEFALTARMAYETGEVISVEMTQAIEPFFIGQNAPYYGVNFGLRESFKTGLLEGNDSQAEPVIDLLRDPVVDTVKAIVPEYQRTVEGLVGEEI